MKAGIRLIGKIIQGVIKMNIKSILAIVLGLGFVFGFMASAYGEVLTVPDPAHQPNPIVTIQDAVNAANPGDTIMVMPGTYSGAFISKEVELIGSGTDQTTIICDLSNRYGFYIRRNTNNVSISQFRFINSATSQSANPIFVYFSNNANISQNEFVGKTPTKMMDVCVMLWGGNGCKITHNVIKDYADGVMIVSNPASQIIQDNLVAFNTISCAGSVSPYVGSGIRLRAMNKPLILNKVVHNNVAYPFGCGIALDADASGLIKSNWIGFNDFRGSNIEIAERPSGVADDNIISRNLGDHYPNRGVTGVGTFETFEVPADIFNPQIP